MREEAAQRSTSIRTRGVTKQIRATKATGSPHVVVAGDDDGSATTSEDKAPPDRRSDGESSDDGEESEAKEGGDFEESSAEEEPPVRPRATGKRATGKRPKTTEDVDCVSTVQVSKTPVKVPAPEREHADWDAWWAYLQQYSDATNQIIVVKYTLNTRGKNKKLRELVSPKPPLPKEIGKYYQRVFHCTHSWKNSQRGTGERTKRFVRGIECPFGFRAQWEKKAGGHDLDATKPLWRLVVYPGCMWHNHRLTHEVFSTYPSKRVCTVQPENLEHTQNMDDLGVPREQIWDMLLDRGENVFKGDVNKIVGGHRARKGATDDDEATAEIVNEFSLTNEGGLVKLSKDDHEVLETPIHNLVYSESAGAYEGNKFALETFCEKASFQKFFEYVVKNWHDCTEMWVMYQRADLPHFRNHTNNRLENYFGKFKKGVKPSSTMADCVEKLIKGARRSALQRTFDNRVGRAWNSNYDEEMNNVLRFTTHLVAGAVFPEYARALDQARVYTYDFPDGPDGQCVEVVSKTHAHHVDLTDWSCNSEFATSMRLPCRHAMAYRKKHRGAVIPLDRIDVRWQRASRVLPILQRITVRHHA